MIVLHSNKNCEKTIELIRKHTTHIRIIRLFQPGFLWFGWNNTFAGRIKGEKFWLFLPHSVTASRPSRFFFGELIDVDGGTIIKGKFKFPLHNFAIYAIGFAIFSFRCFTINYKMFIASLIFFPLFAILAFAIGFFRGRKFEKDTIEQIKKILEN